MSATADVARMLTLVPWLLERPGASVTEIADAFDVSPATIRSDLAHLDFCGLPGLGGGDLFEVVSMGERVVLRMADELRRPLRPTPTEALRLVLTTDAVAEVLGEEVPALRSAVDKVRGALGIPETRADVLAPEAGTGAARLRRAIADANEITLTYQSRDGGAPTTRSVDPWALHVVDGRWYLQGHDHTAGGLRTFRLDRVVDFEVTDRAREHAPPAELDPPRYVPGPDDVEVVLDVSARGRWLADAVTLDAIEDADDGGAHLVLRTDAPTWLARLVLMAAGEARVVSPVQLRELVAEMAEAALARYAG